MNDERQRDPDAVLAAQLGLGASGSTARAWWRRRRVLVPLAALLVIALWLGLAAQRTPAPRWRTEPVERGALVVTVTATGALQPTNQVDVGVEVSGRVARVEVDFNDPVRVGQVLARLDTTKLEQQVVQSVAALASAQARVAQAAATRREAARERGRLADVLANGRALVAERELDAATAALERARAEEDAAAAAVAQARAVLDAQRTELDKALVRSPIDGVVLARSVEPGQTVAAVLQAPVLFTLAESLAQMELVVDVDEADVGQVAAGQPATFTVGAWPARAFPARIEQVRYGAQTVAGVVTYKAVLAVDNSELLLRPGMTATATITVARVEDAVLVPNAALRFVPPQAPAADAGASANLLTRLMRPPRHAGEPAGAAPRQVWIVERGALRAVPVELGATDGTRTEVRSGDLVPGQGVVVDALAEG